MRGNRKTTARRIGAGALVLAAAVAFGAGHAVQRPAHTGTYAIPVSSTGFEIPLLPPPWDRGAVSPPS